MLQLLIACAPKIEEEVIVEAPIEAAIIYPEDSLVLVEEGYLDTILMSDYFIEKNDGVYFTPDPSETKSSVPVSLIEIPDLASKAFEIDFWDIFKEGDPIIVDSGITFGPDSTFTRWRLWWKAECNKTMRGFKAPCMGTFGVHKWWGKSMKWTVKPYKVCGPGRLFCLERMQTIGTIEYHRTVNCADKVPWRRPIQRFACP